MANLKVNAAVFCRFQLDAYPSGASPVRTPTCCWNFSVRHEDVLRYNQTTGAFDHVVPSAAAALVFRWRNGRAGSATYMEHVQTTKGYPVHGTTGLNWNLRSECG
jgi:hypothetical protein